MIDSVEGALTVVGYTKECAKQMGNEISEVVQDPQEAWNTMCTDVTEYVDKNLINGTLETCSKAAGQLISNFW